MLAVRPSEYFPRPDYFALMAQARQFVVADTFQYSRQSFQNRAKVRTPDGWTWMSLPLKGGQHGQPQHATRLRTSVPWQRQHARMLQYNYQTAPFWPHYAPELLALFEAPWETLAALNVATIRLLHRWLGLKTELCIAGELPAQPATLPAVCAALEAETLLVLPDTARHDRAGLAGTGVEVAEIRFDPQPYHQNFAGFVPGMSVLDVLMNYGPETPAMLRAWTGAG